MIALQPADLVLIAGRTLSLDTETVLDLLDHAAAQAALAEAARRPEDPAQAAAALLHALVRRPFLSRGNVQVAVVATTQFLALNGFQIDLDPPGTTKAVIADVAAGRLSPVELAGWLAPRLSPRAGQVSCDRPPSLLKRLPIRRHRRTKSAGDRFHRFTDGARAVLVHAQEEARGLGHDYVGTEHLLLGLLTESQGVAAETLQALGVTSDAVRHQIERIIGPGGQQPRGHIPLTPRAKQAVFEGAMREAMLLGHNYIDTEHLLLGLLRSGEGVAAAVLIHLGAGLDRTREQVLRLVSDPSLAASADTSAMIEENRQLRGEVERLRAQLIRHGIRPDDQRPPAAQGG